MASAHEYLRCTQNDEAIHDCHVSRECMCIDAGFDADYAQHTLLCSHSLQYEYYVNHWHDVNAELSIDMRDIEILGSLE